MTRQEKANEIENIFEGVANGIALALKSAGAMTRDPKAVLAGSFFELVERDEQRSANARKFAGSRLNSGRVEVLTYSVQCLQGGTWGDEDTLTIVSTVEVRGEGIYHLKARHNRKTKVVETSPNGTETKTKNMRGVIGNLKNHNAETIAKALISARIEDETAGIGDLVRDQNAHSFSVTTWTHPTGLGWENEGKQIGSIGKVKA